MRVRLTRVQHRGCLRLVEESALPWAALLGEWMRAEAQDAGRTRIDVVMPAIAWARLREVLFGVCFTEKGFRDREAPSHLANALRTVTTSLNWWESHPALVGVGLIGLHYTVIPAWAIDDGKTWSPYPTTGQFALLTPRHVTERQHRLTTWAPERLVPDPDTLLFQESQHLVFC